VLAAVPVLGAPAWEIAERLKTEPSWLQWAATFSNAKADAEQAAMKDAERVAKRQSR